MRTVTNWDAHGIRFRANIVQVGGVIELHDHDYGHPTMLMSGLWEITLVHQDGRTENFRAASAEYAAMHPELTDLRGFQVDVPAWCKHTLVCIDALTVGHALCISPLGVHQ